MTKHCVYLLEASGLYKIGISKDAHARLKQIQSMCPCRIRLLAMWKLPVRKDIVELERELHRTFADCRVHGEWFDIQADMMAGHEPDTEEPNNAEVRYLVNEAVNYIRAGGELL